MHHPTEKYVIISLLGILLFLFPIDRSASETAGSTPLPRRSGGGSEPGRYLAVAGQPLTAANSDLESQPDLHELVFVINMILLGLLAVALALYRWKANDLSLISFGIFCIIYGVRTEAFEYLVGGPPEVWAYGRWSLTYLTPVPVWFFRIYRLPCLFGCLPIFPK